MTTTHWLLIVIALLWILGAYLLSYLGFAGSYISKDKNIQLPEHLFGVALFAWPFITIALIFSKPRKRTA